jgi:hypothetical protein
MSRLRDFDGFTDGSSGSSDGSNGGSSGSSGWPQLRVVGTTAANMIGAPGVRDRAAAALTAAVRHLKGGDRELLEQVRGVVRGWHCVNVCVCVCQVAASCQTAGSNMSASAVAATAHV